MTKSKKISLSVFALVIVGLSVALIVGLNKIREQYNLLEKVDTISFDLPIQGVNFDKDGYMWVSDSLKLSVYKDSRLVNEYWREELEIRDTGPDIIAFDKKGRVWVASQYQGIAVLDKEKFITIYSADSIFSREGSITAFDLDPKGNAWFGIYDEGITVIDITGKILATYDISNSDLESNTILDIAFDNEGIAWISTFRWKTGLNSFDGSKWETYDVAGGQIAFDREDRVWVGTDFSRISVFDGTDWIYYDYDAGASSIINIVSDNKDRIWVFGDGKLCELCMFDGKIWKYYYPKNQDDNVFSSSYSGYRGNTLATDNEGNVWFVSSYDGAYKISNNFPLFSLPERNFLFFSDIGIFFSLLIILVSLWFVFAARSWRSIGYGVLSGVSIYVIGVWLFHIDALYYSSYPILFSITIGTIGGFMGWLIGRKTGVERRKVIIRIIILGIIVSLIIFFIDSLPQ